MELWPDERHDMADDSSGHAARYGGLNVTHIQLILPHTCVPESRYNQPASHSDSPSHLGNPQNLRATPKEQQKRIKNKILLLECLSHSLNLAVLVLEFLLATFREPMLLATLLVSFTEGIGLEYCLQVFQFIQQLNQDVQNIFLVYIFLA